jgi:hypothetical protein
VTNLPHFARLVSRLRGSDPIYASSRERSPLPTTSPGNLRSGSAKGRERRRGIGRPLAEVRSADFLLGQRRRAL